MTNLSYTRQCYGLWLLLFSPFDFYSGWSFWWAMRCDAMWFNSNATAKTKHGQNRQIIQFRYFFGFCMCITSTDLQVFFFVLNVSFLLLLESAVQLWHSVSIELNWILAAKNCIKRTLFFPLLPRWNIYMRK